MDEAQQEDQGSRLMKAVEAVAISPDDVNHLVISHIEKARNNNPSASERDIQNIAAKAIVNRYAKLSAVSGGSTSLTGIIPGIGTAVAMVGGSMTDATVCMKFQVDMTMCIAKVYGWDIKNEDAKHLSYLIAVGGSLEKVGKEASVSVASKAGVKMLRLYLRGAALKTIKEMFKKIGITFTRKSVEKAIPFGVGVAIGGSTNYALTRYVGSSAVQWFEIDSSMSDKEIDDIEVTS